MEMLRKYGEATTILFPLIDAGTQDFETTPVTFATGDTQIMKDEGAFANATNNPAHEGNGIYSLLLTATEMEAARLVVIVKDSPTKTWEDQAIIVSTYGNASAQNAFDLDTASVAQSGDNYTRLGAPAGATVASDIAAVRVDTAAILIDTAEIGVAGAGLTNLGGMSTGMKAQVKIEVDGALDTAGTELSAIPAATGTLRQKINFIFQYFRNKKTVTSTAETLLKEDASTTLGSAMVSDDGVTFTKGEMN